VDQLIQESQAWLDQYQATKRAELHRLNSKLSQLEAKRSELTERVSRDNADRGSQSELTRTDRSIENTKKKIGALRDEVREMVLAKRSELTTTLNARIAELQARVSQHRTEKERIRTELLPALERQREELVERTREIENEILHMSEEISTLNRINIESQDLEFD
jgi:chromosome segregation ATPase